VNTGEAKKAKGGVEPKGKPNKKRKRKGKAKTKGREKEKEPDDQPDIENEEETGGSETSQQNLGLQPWNNRGSQLHPPPPSVPNRNPAKKRRVGTSPDDDIPPLMAAFPESPSPVQFQTLSGTHDILEPNWEVGSEKDEDGMDPNESPSASLWHSLPRQVVEIEVPTPRVNSTTGLVELVLEKFQYPYRAKVCGTIVMELVSSDTRILLQYICRWMKLVRLFRRKNR
jgi:hypothetical protein